MKAVIRPGTNGAVGYHEAYPSRDIDSREG
jgi:hypothetical protein